MITDDNVLVDRTFLAWVVHREAARVNKEAGHERPWSVDPVVARNRFCNVSREDDRGTVSIKEHIRDPYDKLSSPLNLYRMIIFARLLNRVETFDTLADYGVLDATLDPDWDSIANKLRVMVDAGDTVFSGAYMVTSSGATGMRKTDYAVAMARAAELPDDLTSRQGVHAAIVRDVAGMGSFLAGQVVADMAYTSLLDHAPDHRTWAPLGPGAAKGANLARGRTPNKLISHADYLVVGMRQLAELEETGAADTIPRPLNLHDVASNVNCETYKYHRLHTSDFYKGRIYK